MKISSQGICTHIGVRSTYILYSSSMTCQCCSISSYSTRTDKSGGPTLFLCPCCQQVYPDCTTCLAWKFNPRKFSVTQLILIPQKLTSQKKKYTIWYIIHVILVVHTCLWYVIRCPYFIFCDTTDHVSTKIRKNNANGTSLGWAWASPTLAWLYWACVCVSMLAWTDHLQ